MMIMQEVIIMDKILLVDDEHDILEALKIFLEQENYEVMFAENGKEAIEVISKVKIDLIVMDIMMPIMDGITALKVIREKQNIPIILLTAKAEDQDKINGLDLGADDYITKPFKYDELIARIRAQIRRYKYLGIHSDNQSVLVIGGITLNDNLKLVNVDGNDISLTPMEYKILKYMMQNAKKLLTSKDIYKNVWHEEPIGAEGIIAVHVYHLREKIEIDPTHPKYIKVVWGQGYRIDN